jgi:hypothetical protein
MRNPNFDFSILRFFFDRNGPKADAYGTQKTKTKMENSPLFIFVRPITRPYGTKNKNKSEVRF